MAVPVICNVQTIAPAPPPPMGAKKSSGKKAKASKTEPSAAPPVERKTLDESPSRWASESRPMRLGRHVAHDPRSRGFPAARARVVKSVMHKRNERPFDQGALGSCTGNAIAGACSTAPFGRKLREADAVKAYALATTLDRVLGVYPPDDTGSSGLAAAKAAVRLGWCRGYTHAFGLKHLLEALTLGPGALGIAWLTDCDAPDANGVVSWSGDLRGGHEVELVGIDTDQELVWCCNSWGVEWGKEGLFALTYHDLGRALAHRGDAVFPLL